MTTSCITFFCDDIREEKSGKDTLVGIYSDNLASEKFPINFHRLALYTRINLSVDEKVNEITIRITAPGGIKDELAKLEGEFIRNAQNDAKSKGSRQTGIINKAIIGSAVVSEPGRIEIVVQIDKQEFLSGFLNVIKRS